MADTMRQVLLDKTIERLRLATARFKSELEAINLLFGDPSKPATNSVLADKAAKYKQPVVSANGDGRQGSMITGAKRVKSKLQITMVRDWIATMPKNSEFTIHDMIKFGVRSRAYAHAMLHRLQHEGLVGIRQQGGPLASPATTNTPTIYYRKR